MLKKTLSGLSLFFLGLLAGLLAQSFAQGLRFDEPHTMRLEATLGKCRYGQAQDGTWWKVGYEHSERLLTDCGTVGFSHMPWETPGGRIGYRLAYIDFGKASANAFVPVIDTEANSHPSGQNCNQTTKSGCVGYYNQHGRARGISFGPVIEKETDLGTVGFEAGLYRYRSYWQVEAQEPGPGTCSTCVGYDYWQWNGARGTHWTWYMGATFAKKITEHFNLFLQARRYNSTYASQAKVNPLFIGQISGPLYSLQAGVQMEF